MMPGHSESVMRRLRRAWVAALLLWEPIDRRSRGSEPGFGDRVIADKSAPTGKSQAKKNPPSFEDGLFRYKAPGGDLLLHGLSHTTIGACAFHF